MENKPQFRDALKFWIKLGFISFGGPAGQIAIMHRELVERQKWISEEKFQHAMNFCMLLPGPEAQQLATYNGWLLHGTRGGIAAGAFFVIPSIFILLGLSYIYAKFGEVPQISAVLDGIKAVVVAIVVEAVIKIGKKAFKTNWHILIAAIAFVAIYFLHVPFPLIVLGAGILGYFLVRSPKSEVQSQKSENQSPITNYQLNIVKVFAVCFVLWLIPFLFLLFTLGWKSLQLKVYLFFTQAAFVTFGGAYAVLAYVNQIAVNSYGWLTAQQAIDGFGLAETTPGPLIMVLQFVGFMAGWNNPGEFDQTFSAILTALLTTFATFLPCFFFIFAFAPLIEKFQDNVKLKAILSGVTAAVVGVILNLAIVFGAAVIYHDQIFNWFALIIGAISFVVLLRFKIDVLWIVLGGGILGLIKYFIL
ncbi:MAG: chromate efflux transporter [Acidobacteriota bacterium]|jgi:chromate transporter|nr:chromate efflux transporter [Acidobacteriota bacterium]